MKEECMVKLDDVGKVLLDYIGSEEYYNAVKMLGDDICLLGGIGIAGCLIMSRCTKYKGIALKDKEVES